jgi:hypothetical protein
MKRLFVVLAALTALAALAVTSSASAAPGSTTCTGDMVTPPSGSVVVPAGATCRMLFWGEVPGTVQVAGTLNTFGKITFDKNVTVNGGAFSASNWGVTLNSNLIINNPAPYSYNGFWGNYSPNEVKGNVIYTITSDMAYPPYGAPLLYFGGGATVDGNFNYSTAGVGHLDQVGLTVLGQSNIS